MILLQLYSILFSIAFAYANKVPVLKLERSSSITEERTFHRANLILKILFALIISNGTVVGFVLCGLWQWIVFDVALNLFVGNKWFYTGNTANSDKLLRRVFGKDHAGLSKFLIVLCVILIINFYL